MDRFVIDSSKTFREALKKIESNKHGIVFVEDEQGRVCGSLSDGDIRRLLLADTSIDCELGLNFNQNFVWASLRTPREQLLKQLDNKVRVIPILDGERKLVDLATQSRLPGIHETGVYSRAKSPVRISFGGGGSDLTYFFAPAGAPAEGGKSGAVLNATISLYSHALLRKRNDSRIIIHSRDLKATFEADNIQFEADVDKNFGLILCVIKTIMPEFGFDLTIYSDFEIGSGLGGSSVVAAAILGSFNEFRIDKWTAHEIAELAYQAERIYLGISGGWQDQYATVFGGFNFIEFNSDGNVVYPLRIGRQTLLELEESLVLCNTGLTHTSNDIHESQEKTVAGTSIMDNVEQNVSLTYKTKALLLRGRLIDFARSLDQAWKIKRTFSPDISSEDIDAIYDGALAHGAVGGKLLGAGGGGYFLFFAAPFRRLELIAYLESIGKSCISIKFENEGLTSWLHREESAEVV